MSRVKEEGLYLEPKPHRKPESCHHGVTRRVAGTRDLWRCTECGGLLEDNVTLVRPPPDTPEGVRVIPAS